MRGSVAWFDRMIEAGLSEKVARTAFSIFSSGTTCVPKVSTITETGSATPMA